MRRQDRGQPSARKEPESFMLHVEHLRVNQWRLLKSVRLQALADAPEAFSTTLAQAQQWSDQEWQERARRFSISPPATACMASVDGAPCGMVSCYLSEGPCQAQETVAELTAFWVNPQQRGQGVGEALVACAADWAVTQGAAVLQAWVTASNRRALAFYGKVGFQETGQRQTYEPDPSGHMILLARRLEPPAA